MFANSADYDEFADKVIRFRSNAKGLLLRYRELRQEALRPLLQKEEEFYKQTGVRISYIREILDKMVCWDYASVDSFCEDRIIFSWVPHECDTSAPSAYHINLDPYIMFDMMYIVQKETDEDAKCLQIEQEEELQRIEADASIDKVERDLWVKLNAKYGGKTS